MENIEEKEPPEVITSDTENATQIKPEDAPPHKQEKFRHFRSYNRNTWNGPRRENKTVIHRQDNLHRFDAIASSLDLTKSQKKRGRKLLDEIPLAQFNRGSEKVDDVIFGLCVLLVNNDCPDENRHWPHPHKPKIEERFQEFVDEELNLTYSEQLSIICRVRSEVPL